MHIHHLEIFEANRLRALGWAEYLKIEMASDRRSFKTYYWMSVTRYIIIDCLVRLHRRRNLRAQHAASHQSIPPFGGAITISLNKLSGHRKWHSGHHTQSVIGELDMQSKLGSEKCYSDTVEKMEINVVWEPINNALAIPLAKEQLHLDIALIVVSHHCLRFEVCVT